MFNIQTICWDYVLNTITHNAIYILAFRDFLILQLFFSYFILLDVLLTTRC